MKILFISRLFPHPHGISGSIVIYNRIRFLAERGHSVGLLSFVQNEDMPYISQVKPLLSEMELMPDPRMWPRMKRVTQRVFSMLPYPFTEARDPVMLRKVGDMVERSGYNIAIAEFSVMGQYLCGNSWLPAVRRIVSCHECWTTGCLKAISLQGWSPRGVIRRATIDCVMRYEFDMYRGMDHVLSLTSEERCRLLAHAPELRISVVPHGVDTSYFTPSDKKGCGENIVFVGSYRNESNRDAVFWFMQTVWPDLKNKHPNLKLFVVGRSPTPALRELGRRDPRVVITGAVDDIRPYLAQALVFICPIRMGSGFRAKLIESMASGLPVVSTSLAAEGISAQESDTLFLADTPSQMTRAISLLLTDEELRRSMAERGRRLMTARFSREHGMTVLENVLEDVMSLY